MKKMTLFLMLLLIFVMVGCEYQLTTLNDSNQSTTEEITTEEMTTDVVLTEELTSIIPTTQVASIDKTTEITLSDLTTSVETSSPQTTEMVSTETLTTEVPSTEETTTAVPTTINWEMLVDDIYDQLSEDFPSEISTDYVLPIIHQEDLTIEYYYNRELVQDGIIHYEAKSYTETMDVYVLIILSNFSKSYHFTFQQLRDEDLYQQEITNSIFNVSFDKIINQIPTIIYSDLTLPYEIFDDVEVDYSVDQSYIFNQRLIFTYPQIEEQIILTISLAYNGENRTLMYPIKMSALNDLPKIPELHISTYGGMSIESKEEYVSGRLTMYDFTDNNESIVLIDNVSMQIRLRGNSTMYMPKKPYKIKFDEKQYIFGDYKEKDWVLLANFADQTLIRNGLAFELARGLNMAFVPMVEYVDVFLNGIYQGNYLLTDQIEVTNDRVDIEENTTDIDTGYLLEFDKKLYELDFNTDDNYFIIEGIPFVIKSPDKDDDHYSYDQFIFIENYMNNVFDAIRNQENYHLWIDEASFIDWFIVNEVFKNVDSGYSSVYFYKDKGGLLKMGPVWDFDLSSGNYGHLQEDMRGPEGWYTSLYYKNTVFYYLMQYDEFRLALKTRWNEVYDDVILDIVDQIYPMADSIARSRYDNFVAWDIIGINDEWYTSPEILALDNYEKQLYFLRQFLIERIQWLNTEINQF